MTSVLDNHEVLCLENNPLSATPDMSNFVINLIKARQQCKLPILFNHLKLMMFYNIQLSIIRVGFIDVFSFSDFALLLDF